jgi:hypothetical protein
MWPAVRTNIADVKSMKMGSQKISVISLLQLFMKVHLIN